MAVQRYADGNPGLDNYLWFGEAAEQLLIPLEPLAGSDVISAGKEDTKMRKLTVTKSNVTMVPLDWLCVRYAKLQKEIKKNPRDELLEESYIIATQLQAMGMNELVKQERPTLEDQLELIPLPQKEEYVPVVCSLLREHYRRQLRMTSLEQQLKLSPKLEYPSMTASYSGMPRGGAAASPLEAAFVRQENRLEMLQWELDELASRMYPMNRALDTLSLEQMEIIQQKYLVRREPKDDRLIDEIGIGRQKFYLLKSTAFIRIASSLHLI
ncbi:ArpU family phage transcriptional regulator [Paenibacillus cellulosilyticus]|uniref:ArpU family phage transcriptional regulator n=1 Tax=Paenibacillus cellulosilyticus TaxID=375489 RepID=A0A2V2YW81_9BACL|nr:hypothetical protein [Paenibacillus cellulosilyticus]PWW01194.1 ArpU family phage transcriptional regulator [Paenibacillus cellulosilyticus]QKS46851.1 hypothetical protein HUB94_20420 [Paenibacillus cellulosilyticus]